MPSDRNAARVDLGKRVQECEPRERVAHLIGLQQLQLYLVAPLLPVCREFPVHKVAAVGALAKGEPGPAPEQKKENVAVAGKHGSQYRGLPLAVALITLAGCGGCCMPAPMVEQDGGERPTASRAPEQCAQLEGPAGHHDHVRPDGRLAIGCGRDREGQSERQQSNLSPRHRILKNRCRPNALPLSCGLRRAAAALAR